LLTPDPQFEFNATPVVKTNLLADPKYVQTRRVLLDSLPSRERGGFSPINSVSLEQAIVCNLAG